MIKQNTKQSSEEGGTNLYQFFTAVGFFKIESSDQSDPQKLFAQIDHGLPQLIHDKLKVTGFLQVHQIEDPVVAPQDVAQDAHDESQTVTWVTIVLVRRLYQREQAYDENVKELFVQSLEWALSEIEKNDEAGSSFVLSDFVFFGGDFSPACSKDEVEHHCSYIWDHNEMLRKELSFIKATATLHSEREAA